MGFSTEFHELLPNGASVQTLTGISTDGYGTEVWSTGSTYKALVQIRQEEVVTFGGEIEVSTHVAWIGSTSTFGADSQFTLTPGGTLHVLKLRTFHDEDGVHHSKGWFKGA